jgi:hypothetical protein
METYRESQLEPSNVIASKIEPTHREIPGVQQNSVETSTRPEPGVVSPAMIGLKWAGFAYAALWIVPFLMMISVAAKADWFGGPVGIQIFISVIAMGLAVLSGVWAGKGRPAWRHPAKAVIACHVVSVLMLMWAVRVPDVAGHLAWGRPGTVGLGILSLVVVVIGVLLGMSGRKATDSSAALETRGDDRPAADFSRIAAGVAGGLIAQLALGMAWYQVAKAVIPQTTWS